MSIDSVVNVNVVLQGQAISQAGFGTVMIMTDEGEWPSGMSSVHVASYSTLKEMTDAGWSSSARAYEAASVMLSQALPPAKWKVGRGKTPSAQTTAISVDGNTNGDFTVTLESKSFTYTADGDSATEIAEGLRDLIKADPDYAATTSSTSNISVVGKPGDDFDVAVTNAAGELSIGSTTDADGSAIRLEDNVYPADSDWYGLISTIRNPSEIESLTWWSEANKRLYVSQLADSNALIAGSTASVPYGMKAASAARSAFIYHSDNDQYADAGWIAGKLAVDPDVVSTTWAHYTIRGVTTDNLTSAQQDALEAVNANYYVLLGGSGSTYKGTCADGTFIDNVLASDWFRTRLIEKHQARFTEYSNAGKKIPYTDVGIGIVESDLRDITERGIAAGHFLRREKTDSQSESPKYTVPSRSEVPSADVSNRVYKYQVEVVLAGAIHSLTVTAYLPLT